MTLFQLHSDAHFFLSSSANHDRVQMKRSIFTIYTHRHDSIFFLLILFLKLAGIQELLCDSANNTVGRIRGHRLRTLIDIFKVPMVVFNPKKDSAL